MNYVNHVNHDLLRLDEAIAHHTKQLFGVRLLRLLY